MGLPATRLPQKNEVPSLTEQFRAQIASKELTTEIGLQGEVEIIDGLEEGEVGIADGSLDTSLLSMSDLLADQHGKEITTGPGLGLGSLNQRLPASSGIRKVQALEHQREVQGFRVELDIRCCGFGHGCAS
jgi:hypothetical protein